MAQRPHVLEEYYENEWDNNKDQLTVCGSGTYDNQSLSIETYGRINDFFTQTQWLPRLDHYWLGEPLIGDQLTWFEHSNIAYANMGIASTPTNPTLASQFERFPWEEDSAGNPISGQGGRFVTRQEIDYPLDFAPFKVVPFALGELYHAGEDINANPVDRAYVNAGIRASIPFWYADPSIREPLFNLNGLAHKVVFDAQFSWADASQNLDRFPLYDELDDDSIEDFSRRLFFSPFGGILPGLYYIPGSPSFIDPKFDPRFYALRYGLQDWVTSPSSEIADDLMALRLGMHHRLQTKHGVPGQERIVDWMTFDADATVFPDATRDDAGATVGLINYDWHWFLGDRFSILSDGYADTFGDGLKTAAIGLLVNRPRTGNFYLGFRAATGLFEADVLTTTVNYRMTEKWIGSASSAVDFGPTGNIGQVALLHSHRRIAARHRRQRTSTPPKARSAPTSSSSRVSYRRSTPPAAPASKSPQSARTGLSSRRLNGAFLACGDRRRNPAAAEKHAFSCVAPRDSSYSSSCPFSSFGNEHASHTTTLPRCAGRWRTCCCNAASTGPGESCCAQIHSPLQLRLELGSRPSD